MRKSGQFWIALVLAIAAVAGGRDVSSAPAPPASAAAGGCGLTFTSPLHIPLASTKGAIVIDDACEYVYITNKALNRIEVFSLATLSLEAPIQVGAQPHGLDITADGSLLYVANTGGTNISVVDLTQRVELRKINVPSGFSNDRPYSIAIANNGLAMFSTTFAGSGFGGRLLQLVLATDATSLRSDFFSSGSTTEQTQLKASEDRSVIGAMAGDISSGPIFKYAASTDTWGAPRNLQAFISGVSLDMTGSTLLAQGFSGTYVLDSALNLSGTITPAGWGGTAVDPTFSIGYKSVGNHVDILNTSTFLKTGELPLGDTVNNASLSGIIGHMDLSGDGTLLAAITDNGFSLVRPLATTPQDINLVRNGSFGSGFTRWLRFATPDLNSIVSNVVGGVLEFYRVPPAPGTSNQAVVYQETGMSVPAGAPLHAQFSLGNSSSVRKRISVLLLDGDFSDLHVCTFWLPPALPLTPFEMRSRTTEAWTNASIYFYAATPGSDGGAYRLDNVSLRYDTDLPTDRTDCVDPLRPVATGGPDGPDLLVNGDFGIDPPLPWATFGTITSQVSGGVFEFVRPTSAPPAGVVFQLTGQPAAAGTILTATFDLGNSSAVRKRVTVLLLDSDFSDLAACTFWLAPGQPLSPYIMRTYATRAWADAMISVYAASIGPEQWTQLDNVTFRSTPATPIIGTECHEPPSTVPSEFSARSAAAPVRSAGVPSGGRTPGSITTAALDRPRTPGGSASSLRVDLTDATAARLQFESSLMPGGLGEVQLSLDGVTWMAVAHARSSGGWESMDVDLSPWAGHRVWLRFVQGDARSASGPWWLTDIRVVVPPR